jgi:hypothetical protein
MWIRIATSSFPSVDYDDLELESGFYLKSASLIKNV